MPEQFPLERGPAEPLMVMASDAAQRAPSSGYGSNMIGDEVHLPRCHVGAEHEPHGSGQVVEADEGSPIGEPGERQRPG